MLDSTTLANEAKIEDESNESSESLRNLSFVVQLMAIVDRLKFQNDILQSKTQSQDRLNRLLFQLVANKNEHFIERKKDRNNLAVKIPFQSPPGKCDYGPVMRIDRRIGSTDKEFPKNSGVGNEDLLTALYNRQETAKFSNQPKLAIIDNKDKVVHEGKQISSPIQRIDSLLQRKPEDKGEVEFKKKMTDSRFIKRQSFNTTMSVKVAEEPWVKREIFARRKSSPFSKKYSLNKSSAEYGEHLNVAGSNLVRSNSDNPPLGSSLLKPQCDTLSKSLPNSPVSKVMDRSTEKIVENKEDVKQVFPPGEQHKTTLSARSIVSSISSKVLRSISEMPEDGARSRLSRIGSPIIRLRRRRNSEVYKSHLADAFNLASILAKDETPKSIDEANLSEDFKQKMNDWNQIKEKERKSKLKSKCEKLSDLERNNKSDGVNQPQTESYSFRGRKKKKVPTATLR